MQTVKKYLNLGCFAGIVLLNLPVFIMGFISWWIGCAIANRFPPLVGRFKNTALQTPMVLYRHPKTGARVLLIGTIHIAEPAYFSKIRKQIEQYETSEHGATVLYESVKKTGWDPSELSDEERDNINRLDRILEEMKEIAKASDLQHQFDGIPIKEGWINTDIELAEVAKALHQKGVRNILVGGFEKSEIGKQMFLFTFDLFAQSAALGMRLVKPMTYIRKRERAFHKVVVERRNDVGFQGIVEYTDAKKLTISIWGAGHIPGLDKRLRNAGYQRIGVRWVSAYHLRNPPLHKTMYEEVKAGRISFKRPKRS